MGTPQYPIAVVIASRCNDARGELLRRACDSVCAMGGRHEYSIVVVANGDQVSPAVLEWLGTRSDTRVIRLRTGSHPLARSPSIALSLAFESSSWLGRILNAD